MASGHHTCQSYATPRRIRGVVFGTRAADLRRVLRSSQPTRSSRLGGCGGSCVVGGRSRVRCWTVARWSGFGCGVGRCGVVGCRSARVGEVFADAVVVVDAALGLVGLVFVGSTVGVGAVVGRPPAGRWSGWVRWSGVRQRADRCAATAANNAQRANRPRRRRFAHTRRVFAAVRANRRRRRRFARSERLRWPTRAAVGRRAERLERPSGRQNAREDRSGSWSRTQNACTGGGLGC